MAACVNCVVMLTCYNQVPHYCSFCNADGNENNGTEVFKGWAISWGNAGEIIVKISVV